jgi:hypothetical protein
MNVKTWWISMLNPWKHVMVEYKALMVKMHFDQKKAKYACENLELLCDLELTLAMPCFMPMLKVVHTFIKYIQFWDVFIINFVDVMNLVKVRLSYLYIDLIFNFDDFTFDNFTKLLSQILWCFAFLLVFKSCWPSKISWFKKLYDKFILSTFIA